MVLQQIKNQALDKWFLSNDLFCKTALLMLKSVRESVIETKVNAKATNPKSLGDNNLASTAMINISEEYLKISINEMLTPPLTICEDFEKKVLKT